MSNQYVNEQMNEFKVGQEVWFEQSGFPCDEMARATIDCICGDGSVIVSSSTVGEVRLGLDEIFSTPE